MSNPHLTINALSSDLLAKAELLATNTQPPEFTLEATRELAKVGMFGSPEERTVSHLLTRQIAESKGIYLASIQDFYNAIGKGETKSDLTVPALNVRAVAYDTALAIFSAIEKNNVGAVIFELSRGEIGFTQQRPMQYVTSILNAAIASGFTGPVFFQGDHYQVSPSKYAENSTEEVGQVEALIKEAVSAGFYNIDIDTSTLVDLSKPNVTEQQRLNFEICAQLSKVCREVEPKGITISIGGEIGEVGEHNTTEEEVDAFMQGMKDSLPGNLTSISKLSVQTGTKHGGNVLPDGTLGDMDINFQHLDFLGQICRKKHNIGGVVQHGASTLPLHKFNGFPKAQCLEIHLAATLLNTVYDEMPNELEEEAYTWLKEKFQHEWSESMTEKQFLYHARRFSVGPFQKVWWNMDSESLSNIRSSLTEQISEFFVRLGVADTKELIQEFTKPVPVELNLNDLFKNGIVGYEVLTDLAD
ncbi:class II fructose-bisphosphate aldolase [Vibrio tasmaniensis]|uniref:class II fructose-bisphosphate aldolase n=1 Tax=Vibrio tasmaniensis TaxID=212663 RepID=UPI00107F2028|nr:class II fructose-bisphosphate aldolase [Vibrio tasmaniensis]